MSIDRLSRDQVTYLSLMFGGTVGGYGILSKPPEFLAKVTRQQRRHEARVTQKAMSHADHHDDGRPR